MEELIAHCKGSIFDSMILVLYRTEKQEGPMKLRYMHHVLTCVG